jgi:hypothetical protein
LLTRLLLLSVVLIPMMLVCEAALRRGDYERLTGAVAGGTALMLGIVLWAWRTAKRLKNSALGFDGERAVGEELNRLMLDGCLVFHDLSLENRGNIDHVVVAPHAVFAVETKARRKRKPERADQEDYKVAYTGQELVFPFGRGTKELEQARKNATALAGRLGRLIREDIAVLPALVLPGWFIERIGRGEVIVVNDSPKQLRGRCWMPEPDRCRPGCGNRSSRNWTSGAGSRWTDNQRGVRLQPARYAHVAALDPGAARELPDGQTAAVQLGPDRRPAFRRGAHPAQHIGLEQRRRR